MSEGCLVEVLLQSRGIVIITQVQMLSVSALLQIKLAARFAVGIADMQCGFSVCTAPLFVLNKVLNREKQ